MGVELNSQPYLLINSHIPDCSFADVPLSEEKLSGIQELIYIAPYYAASKDGKEYPLTNVFYIELKSPGDIDKLERVAEENNVTIVRKMALDNAYILSCTKDSRGNALQMANWFYETGLFLSAAPEFQSLSDN